MAQVAIFYPELAHRPAPADATPEQARFEIGQWVTDGFDVVVYYVDSLRSDDFGPLSECVVVARGSKLNGCRDGKLIGAVWLGDDE